MLTLCMESSLSRFLRDISITMYNSFAHLIGFLCNPLLVMKSRSYALIILVFVRVRRERETMEPCSFVIILMNANTLFCSQFDEFQVHDFAVISLLTTILIYLFCKVGNLEFRKEQLFGMKIGISLKMKVNYCSQQRTVLSHSWQ